LSAVSPPVERTDRLPGRGRAWIASSPCVPRAADRTATGLVARIVEGGYTPLSLVRDLVFRAGTVRVEFTEDGQLRTPSGEFTRVGDRLR
jgi:hypothetical protein